MRKIRRQKSWEYRRDRKSEKFLKLHRMFLELKRVNSKKFIEEIEELKNANLRQFFKKIKTIGSRQGESLIESFSLPCHT